MDDLCADIWRLLPCLSGQGLDDCCADLRMRVGSHLNSCSSPGGGEGAAAEGGTEPAAILSVPLQKAINSFPRPGEKVCGFYDPYYNQLLGCELLMVLIAF